MDKFFFPQNKPSQPPFINIDGDTALILMLILIILKEKGDSLLILALIYILT